MIETSEVAELLKTADPKLRVINASWYLPGVDIDPHAQHVENRLTETTQYFSVAEVVKPDSDLPNTLPSSEIFSEHMRAIRVRKDDTIICYDHVGMFSVARCAWMLRFFGASNVRIMNGGLQKWISEGRSVFSGAYSAGEGLTADGDYNYGAAEPERVITDISKVHEIAGNLHNGATDW